MQRPDEAQQSRSYCSTMGESGHALVLNGTVIHRTRCFTAPANDSSRKWRKRSSSRGWGLYSFVPRLWLYFPTIPRSAERHGVPVLRGEGHRAQWSHQAYSDLCSSQAEPELNTMRTFSSSRSQQRWLASSLYRGEERDDQARVYPFPSNKASYRMARGLRQQRVEEHGEVTTTEPQHQTPGPLQDHSRT